MKMAAPDGVTTMAVALRCSTCPSAEVLRLHSFLMPRTLAGVGQNCYQALIVSARVSNCANRVSLLGSSTAATPQLKSRATIRFVGYFSAMPLGMMVEGSPVRRGRAKLSSVQQARTVVYLFGILLSPPHKRVEDAASMRRPGKLN